MGTVTGIKKPRRCGGFRSLIRNSGLASLHKVLILIESGSPGAPRPCRHELAMHAVPFLREVNPQRLFRPQRLTCIARLGIIRLDQSQQISLRDDGIHLSQKPLTALLLGPRHRCERLQPFPHHTTSAIRCGLPYMSRADCAQVPRVPVRVPR